MKKAISLLISLVFIMAMIGFIKNSNNDDNVNLGLKLTNKWVFGD